MINNIVRFFEPGWELWRPAFSVDADYKGAEETFAKVADIQGRMRPQSSGIRGAAEKDTYFEGHRFYTDHFDIQPGDRLRKDGQEYRAISPMNPMQFDEFLQVDCEVIER